MRGKTMEGQDELQKLPQICCDVCEKQFSTSSSMYRHLRNVHRCQVSLPKVPQLLCALCSYTCSSVEKLKNHCKTEHQIKMEEEVVSFKCESEFFTWKANVEKETSSLFVKHGGTMERDGIEYAYYWCHRSGNFKSRGRGKRKLKTTGSNKINAACPAGIKFRKLNEQNMQAEFTKTHVGHTLDLKFVPLKNDERRLIAAKLEQGLPFETILDDVHDMTGAEKKEERMCLLTRQDIHNIKRCFIDKDGKSISRDALSLLDSWVQSIATHEWTSVKLYKKPGVVDETLPFASKDDLILVIMNEVQRDLLQLFGSDVICVDLVHQNYDFVLYFLTISVLVEEKGLCPVAFILSSQRDSDTLVAAFKSIERTVQIQTKVFASDTSDELFDAWFSVFNVSELKDRYFCSWHVDQEWRENLTMIEDRKRQAEVYKMCRRLLTLQSEPQEFSAALMKTVGELLADNSTENFAVYFREKFVKNLTFWAWCTRKWCSVESHLLAERLHQTTKNMFVAAMKVKRLDRFLPSLMKFVRDKQVNRLLLSDDGREICSKMKLKMRKRHAQSLKLARDVVSKQVNNPDDESDSFWSVQCTDETHQVNERGHENCPVTISQVVADELCIMPEICPLSCPECQVCTFNYACTCSDYTVEWNMCEHIHLVCRSGRAESNCEFSPEEERVEEEEIIVPASAQQQEEAFDVLQTFPLEISLTECEDKEQPLPDVRKSIQQHLSNLVTFADTCESVEQLQLLDNLLSQTRAAVEGAAEIKRSFAFQSETTYSVILM